MPEAKQKPMGRVSRRISTNKNKLVRVEGEIDNLRRAVANLQEIMTDLRLRVRMLEREHV